METVKYVLIPVIWSIAVASSGVCFLVFLIKKLLRKDTHKITRKLIISVIISVLLFVVIMMYVPSEEVQSSETAATNTTETSEEALDLSSEVTQDNETVRLGETKDNPFVLKAEELAAEIEQDIDAAKEKYNNKWVKITGTISDTSDGGIMYGYYLYGKKSTSGYTGLRIMCWCEDGPYSGAVIGDTKTFLGQLREVTTFNVTEIGDCEIVSE